ncbi:hypothetical protein TGMAS_289060 [Toxoplasma gondii MAS]|uniref:Uncharacterized protein n=2 Tax=Toxoplasma gondii TaxID=5811 RepID=A0A086QHD0_TOXGO|nr:hypothetical protein TGMAS_289060 [Toxoplasma gondii MAS]PUA90123.1 hypothetical protein TGBR9_289060 [Toxoplasma gondii TgCATBr9]
MLLEQSALLWTASTHYVPLDFDSLMCSIYSFLCVPVLSLLWPKCLSVVQWRRVIMRNRLFCFSHVAVRLLLSTSKKYARCFLASCWTGAYMWFLLGRISIGAQAGTSPVAFHGPLAYPYEVPMPSRGFLEVTSPQTMNMRLVTNPAVMVAHGQGELYASPLIRTQTAWMPQMPPRASGQLPTYGLAPSPYSFTGAPLTGKLSYRPEYPISAGPLIVQDEQEPLQTQVRLVISEAKQHTAPPSPERQPGSYRSHWADAGYKGELNLSEADLHPIVTSKTPPEKPLNVSSSPQSHILPEVPTTAGTIKPAVLPSVVTGNLQPFNTAYTGTPFLQQLPPGVQPQPPSSSNADAYMSPLNVAASSLTRTMLQPTEYYGGEFVSGNPLTIAQLVNRLVLQDERFVHALLDRHGPDLTDISTGEVVQALASSDPTFGRLSQFFRRHLGPTLEILKDAHRTLVEPHMPGGEKRLEGTDAGDENVEVAAHLVSFVENDPMLHTLSDIVVNRLFPGIEAFVEANADSKSNSPPAEFAIQ